MKWIIEKMFDDDKYLINAVLIVLLCVITVSFISCEKDRRMVKEYVDRGMSPLEINCIMKESSKDYCQSLLIQSIAECNNVK
jgi:hypothetical protein